MSGETYQSAGVDVNSLDDIKERIGAFARITHGPQVLANPNGFAGLFQLTGFRNPVLVASTDGVGTKSQIAITLGHFESLGKDLVNLNVNDIVTMRAKPLFFLDYISMTDIDSQRVESLMRGIAWACKETECALIGGETAQMPGVYSGDSFDLAGFIVGAVEFDDVSANPAIEEGDILIGIPSSGVHTNGFSLIRHVFDIDSNKQVLYKHFDDLGHTLGEELLIPHKSYYPLLANTFPLIKGMAHITGGGIVGNMPRILPEGLSASFNLRSWQVPSIFNIICKEGKIDVYEMYSVFNMGLGMVMICDPSKYNQVIQEIPESLVVGQIVKKDPKGVVVLE